MPRQWLDVWTSFDLNPATGGWRRTKHYPQALASMVTHDFDGLGRLARVQGYTDSHDFDTHLHWRGDLYSGRTQHFSATADPFRELAAFDDLGQRNAWTYTAVDTDTSGFPFDMARGERYCGGKWTHECSRPLYHQSAVRDVMGRVASLSWHFGHPADLADHGGTGITTAHAEHWRGYTYDKRSALQAVWSHRGPTGQGANDDPLWDLYHVIATPDVEAFGHAYRSSGAKVHDYLREDRVGGLRAIENRYDPSDIPWSATPRAAGHQLTKVEVDHTTYGIEHDLSGSVNTGLDLDFAYDPYGRLIAAFDHAGTLVEAFAHTADGRLAARYGADGKPVRFVHDGNQIVAAINFDNTPLWQAVFGPGIDQLLLWHDHVRDTAYIPLVDHRNSVVATWNTTTGSIDELAAYDPQGRTTLYDVHEKESCREQGQPGVHCVAPSGMPFGFVSGFRSEATGLVYMRNRWYEPRLGQFMSHDPLGAVDSHNLFAYAAMDPINGWDPWGLANQSFTSIMMLGLKEGWYGTFVIVDCGLLRTCRREVESGQERGEHQDAKAQGAAKGTLNAAYYGLVVPALLGMENDRLGSPPPFAPDGPEEELGHDIANVVVPLFAGAPLWSLSRVGAVSGGRRAQLAGEGYEQQLVDFLGGTGGFSKGGRQFDGAFGPGNRHWYEAKSGDAWKQIMSSDRSIRKFKSDMGQRRRIAKEHGASYEVISDTSIPESLKHWLESKGIPYTENFRPRP